MTYTLHGNNSILYEIVETDLPQDKLQNYWNDFYEDEHFYNFKQYCLVYELPIKILNFNVIHYTL